EAREAILGRPAPSPEDVAGMYAAEGIVTARGGRTSHAAVVAVGMGKPCIVGAGGIVVDEERGVFAAGGRTRRCGRRARECAAGAVGLVRTEHMFFAADRIPIVREMIMAADHVTRRAAVQKLLPFQRDDFIGIFRAMNGLPVTIRLLDPPLHEFLANPKEYREMLEERCRLDALNI